VKPCEIYPVPYEKSFRWKWRPLAAEARAEGSELEYQLFYECVLAARASGYEPKLAQRAAHQRRAADQSL
jgi:hypothetical protein